MLRFAWENSHCNPPFGTRQVPLQGPTDRRPATARRPTGFRRQQTDRRKSPRRKPPSARKQELLVEQDLLYTKVSPLLTFLEDFLPSRPRQVPFPRPTAAPGRSSELSDARLERRRSLQLQRLERRNGQQREALSLTFSENCQSLAHLSAVWRFPTASHRSARCDGGVRRSDPTVDDLKRWRSPPFLCHFARKPLQKVERVKLYLFPSVSCAYLFWVARYPPLEFRYRRRRLPTARRRPDAGKENWNISVQETDR